MVAIEAGEGCRRRHYQPNSYYQLDPRTFFGFPEIGGRKDGSVFNWLAHHRRIVLVGPHDGLSVAARLAPLRRSFSLMSIFHARVPVRLARSRLPRRRKSPRASEEHPVVGLLLPLHGTFQPSRGSLETGASSWGRRFYPWAGDPLRGAFLWQRGWGRGAVRHACARAPSPAESEVAAPPRPG